eukprot:scaffold11378_cov20-Tisochrysis_lutea.AAC.1
MGCLLTALTSTLYLCALLPLLCSHHSHSSGWFGMWPMMMPFPGGGAPTEAGRETGDAGPAGGVGGIGGVGAAGAGSEAAGPGACLRASQR